MKEIERKKAKNSQCSGA